MPLLLNQPSKLCLGKPVLVRRSSSILCNGLSSSLLQTPPCCIFFADPCGAGFGKLVIKNATDYKITKLEKKVSLDLLDSDEMITIGASHGWVATMEEDRIVCLGDFLNPVASDTDPKYIPLVPRLVTLPHCQTQIVTNIAMSKSSPEDEDCIVAVKFLGPQLSFYRPAHRYSGWINIRIENPCFFSSPVMFSEKHDMFRIPGSGGHLIGSWDLHTHTHNPKLQRLRLQNHPKLLKSFGLWELQDACYTSEHLVESRTTGETFLVKWYRKAVWRGMSKLKTKAIMVFKLDDEGNAVYTTDIGDLCIFLSKSEPFCVKASSFPGLRPNLVNFFDVDEVGYADLHTASSNSKLYQYSFGAPYHIPPQNITSKYRLVLWNLV